MTRGAETAAGATRQPPPLWASRAGVAEIGVLSRHLHRVWALPRTALGAVSWPAAGRGLHLHWNFWWQAHLLDCLVDAQLRAPTPSRRATIERLLRGIRLRNFGWWTNDYYDDVAWLGLAVLRADQLVGVQSPGALDAIAGRLRAGWTDHAGGGIWWRRGDTFKNVPANGPAAILLTRLARSTGDRADRQRARATVLWMHRQLLDPGTGLLWDGLYVRPDGSVREVVRLIYTYCQGVFLGACAELATDEPTGPWTELAQDVVAAVATHLAPGGVLTGNGGGDGGLFAGILARYLALAAPGLGPASPAARLVYASARSAWRNRGAAPAGPLFGPDWSQPAVTPRGVHGRRAERDLSVQLSGWMVLEAAAALERA